MKFSIRNLIWGIVLLALLVVGGMAFRPQPVDVETAAAELGELEIFVREDGKTRIREKYVVSTPMAGRLARIELNVGDEICDAATRIAVIQPVQPSMLDARSEAQARARVDQTQTAVRRAEAAAEQVRVELELAQTKLERAEKLAASRAISSTEFDDTRSRYQLLSQRMRTAEFDSEIARYELQMAQAALLQYSDSPEASGTPFEVFAPVHGQVLRVFQESATVVDLGMPLVEVGDPQNLEIEIDVLSTDAVRIRPGAHLSIDHWGGDHPLHGTVRRVEPAAYTKISSLGVEEQRVNIIADFNEPLERLIPLGDGYRVEAKIIVEALQQVVVVPNSSLFRYQRQWHVFAIDGDRAYRRPITLGKQNETHSEIVEGLAPGTEVVLYPSDQIGDGSWVRQSTLE